jgi:hypothetical protein
MHVHSGPKGGWQIFVYLLALGAVLAVTAWGSLAAKRVRGFDAPTGQIRGTERMAKPQLKIGAVMAVIGALGFGFWWAFVR